MATVDFAPTCDPEMRAKVLAQMAKAKAPRMKGEWRPPTPAPMTALNRAWAERLGTAVPADPKPVKAKPTTVRQLLAACDKDPAKAAEMFLTLYEHYKECAA